MMMDTTGFQKFLESSKKEDEDRKKNEMNLMADTAGFQKILQLSQQEEEVRKQKDDMIKVNEEKLLQRAIQ